MLETPRCLNGIPMDSLDAQNFERTLTPVEAMEKLFGHQWEDRIKD
jgi:hypothetical protein